MTAPHLCIDGTDHSCNKTPNFADMTNSRMYLNRVCSVCQMSGYSYHNRKKYPDKYVHFDYYKKFKAYSAISDFCTQRQTDSLLDFGFYFQGKSSKSLSYFPGQMCFGKFVDSPKYFKDLLRNQTTESKRKYKFFMVRSFTSTQRYAMLVYNDRADQKDYIKNKEKWMEWAATDSPWSQLFVPAPPAEMIDRGVVLKVKDFPANYIIGAGVLFRSVFDQSKLLKNWCFLQEYMNPNLAYLLAHVLGAVEKPSTVYNVLEQKKIKSSDVACYASIGNQHQMIKTKFFDVEFVKSFLNPSFDFSFCFDMTQEPCWYNSVELNTPGYFYDYHPSMISWVSPTVPRDFRKIDGLNSFINTIHSQDKKINHKIKYTNELYTCRYLLISDLLKTLKTLNLGEYVYD